jgi:hypothetical protein
MYVNDLEISESPAAIRLRMGPIPVGEFDVEAAKRHVEEVAAARPNGRFHVIGMGPPLCRLLVESGAVAGLGWTVLTPSIGSAPVAHPAVANGRTLTNEHLRIDGTLDLHHLASGTVFRGLMALHDGGDDGDEYNYSPPERDVIISAPSSLDTTVVRPGPLEGRLRVSMRFKVPSAIASNRKGRARRTVVLPVAMDLSLRSGEPFLRAMIRVTNTARDHRLRAHFPLPFRTDHSDADGAFDVVRRGLEAEGGFEFGLPTFPCRRWVDASDGDIGLALLHRGTPEYELVDGHGLAVTLLRSVGWLSRQELRFRSGPAGPAIETPGAQLLGEHTFRLAIYPHAGDWRSGRVNDAAERFALPFRSVGVRSHPGSLGPTGAPLSVDPGDIRLSALTRIEGRTECRLYNASPQTVVARLRVGAPLAIGSPARVDLLGGERERLASSEGIIELRMRPWEIATVGIA